MYDFSSTITDPASSLSCRLTVARRSLRGTRGAELDELGAKLVRPFAIADLILDLPQRFVDPSQFGLQFTGSWRKNAKTGES